LLRNYSPTWCGIPEAKQVVASDKWALENAFFWAKSSEGHNHWCAFRDMFIEGDTFDTVWNRINFTHLAIPSSKLKQRIKVLETAICTTLKESKHLAVGDECTLIHLKNALVDKT
jgi:hypothetical protein